MKKLTHNLQTGIRNTLLIIGIVFSSNSLADNHIGQVIHTNGGIIALSDNGNRILSRGSSIRQGDIIKTNTNSRTQLRMIDGALIILRQNSEMHFEEYRFDEKDESIGSSIFSLIRGGFKTLSGLIGKRNKKNYQVKTAFTTIGIRGTNYGITICEADNCKNDQGEILSNGLYASVIDGEISSTNEAGMYVFSNDEYFYVASNDSKPQAMLKTPGVIFDPNIVANSEGDMNTNNEYADLLTEHSLNQSAATHSNMNRKNILADNDSLNFFFEASNDVSNNSYRVYSKLGDAMMFSYFQDTLGTLNPNAQTLVDDGSMNNRFVLNAIAADSGLFIPLALNISLDGTTSSSLYIANATINDVGSMNIAGSNISWGRWDGDLYETTENGSSTSHTGSLHYAVIDGGLTTPTQISAMTGNFNYTTVAGTKATDLDGNVAANIAEVNMVVDFGLQSIDSFAIATQVGGIDYQAELIKTTSITNAIDSGIKLAGNSLGLCPTCGGLANLGFVGAQAEGAIASYNIGNADASTAITGIAVLTR